MTGLTYWETLSACFVGTLLARIVTDGILPLIKKRRESKP